VAESSQLHGQHDHILCVRSEAWLFCDARRCAAPSGQRQRRLQMLRRRLYFVPAPAKTAAFTGTYIFIVGLAVIAAPRSCFGLLFDAR